MPQVTTKSGRTEFLRNDLMSDVDRLQGQFEEYITALTLGQKSRAIEYGEVVVAHVKHELGLLK
jgi:hypothetical protein